MPNRSTDALFLLIQSLEKSEKRSFKLFVNRNSGAGDLKIIQLFDALNEMGTYDEDVLLKKNPAIQKQQLSNLKAHLYRELLTSLRLIKQEENIDLQLHEQLDFARILYNKGLYHQSLKILEKIKDLSKANNQVTYLLQALFLEKNIEGLHITRSLQDRAENLAAEVEETNYRLNMIGALSNLSLQLYSWYIKNGLARNKKDADLLDQFFNNSVIDASKDAKGFYELMYRYQCYSWYAFITQDLIMYYRYCQKWVDLFHANPKMIDIETAHYIKGMHNLMGAHFDLRNFQKLAETILAFETFSQTPIVLQNHNNHIQVFVYLQIAKLNQHFLQGSFTEGLADIPFIETKLQEYELYLDRHRVLVFYYKIASLYFGSGNHEKSIDYLNKIINLKVDLRTDLQCYARLLHLIAHYELGNLDILDYLLKSVYRFMYKMETLSTVEEAIFTFVKNTLRLTDREIKTAFKNLLAQLKELENERFETRAFMYLDIISWLESKINGIPVQTVVQQKYIEAQKKALARAQVTN